MFLPNYQWEALLQSVLVVFQHPGYHELFCNGSQELGFAPTSTGWAAAHALSLFVLHCNIFHCKSSNDSSVNISFVSFAQLLMGIFLVSRRSRGLPRCKSLVLTFLELPFRMLSCTALWGVKIYDSKSVFPLWVPGGWGISFNIYKTSNFEFFMESCDNLLVVNFLSANWNIFPCQCKCIYYGFKVKETFFISFISDCR